MSRRRASAGQGGFTLVELLVALMLLGMVSLMIVGGLRFGSRSWERTVTGSEGLNAVAATQGFLRARLADSTGVIVGDEKNLEFESVWMTAIGGGATYHFTLSLTGEGALSLAWAPAGEDDPPEELTGERDLVDGIESLAISYYGESGDAEGDEAWVDAWEEERGIRPRLVRIALTFKDRRRTWPPLVVALSE